MRVGRHKRTGIVDIIKHGGGARFGRRVGQLGVIKLQVRFVVVPVGQAGMWIFRRVDHGRIQWCTWQTHSEGKEKQFVSERLYNHNRSEWVSMVT